MTTLPTPSPPADRDATWHTPPRNQGQARETSYASDLDTGAYWRRTRDHSDGETTYAYCYYSDAAPGADDAWMPWVREPEGVAWTETTNQPEAPGTTWVVVTSE